MSNKKITIETARQLFSLYNLELLEDEYISRTTKMRYRCSKHPELIQYRSYQMQIANKRGCQKCSKERASLKMKRDFSSVIDTFNKLNLDLLEINFDNRNALMKFRCRTHDDIVQERPFDSIERGYGCRICTALEKSKKLSGENSPLWKGGLKSFNDSLRNSLVKWKSDILSKHNQKCFVSGRTENLIIHHLRPFNEIRDEVLRELGFDAYFRRKEWTFDDFTDEEVILIKFKIKEKHTLDLGVPLTEELHKEFHNSYGMKTNLEDLLDFKRKIRQGAI